MPFVMFRGLIYQWINIERRKTVKCCIEQVWQITDYILFIIFSTWLYQLWFYQYFISSLSYLNFCHLFLPVFQPSINTSPNLRYFCIAIAKYQPLYFKKIHLQLHINDEDRDTNTTISFYMVLKHKNLTNEMHWTEIPSTYSVASLMLTTVSCSFFPKCYNAWQYMIYGNVSCKKNKNTV